MRFGTYLATSLFSLLTLAPPALAAECDAWKAEIWDVEGGKAMTAHICNPATGDDRQPMLYLQCQDKDVLAMRFDDGGEGNPPDGNPEWGADFTIGGGETKIVTRFQYEAMDGVLYAPVPLSGPLAALLKGGDQITIAPPIDNYKTRTFPLKGSSAAIATLAKTCR